MCFSGCRICNRDNRFARVGCYFPGRSAGLHNGCTTRAWRANSKFIKKSLDARASPLMLAEGCSPAGEENMTGDISGKTVIVTGAGSGLGKAMALGLARAGGNVLAADIDAAALDKTAADAEGPGAIKTHAFDVRKVDACAACIDASIAAFGGLHGVFNCAGLGMPYLKRDYMSNRLHFWEADPQRWQDLIDVNLRGPFLLARAAMPHLLAQKWGRIVNVTTSFNTMMRGGNMPYGQSKAGLEAATASWADDAKGSGVTVNVLIPGGAADTPMVPDESLYERDKLVRPDVMIAPAVWLMSDESNEYTGMRFIGRFWDPQADWRDAVKAAGSPAAWPDLANAAAGRGQPKPQGAVGTR